jgi:hypothetical protein
MKNVALFLLAFEIALIFIVLCLSIVLYRHRTLKELHSHVYLGGLPLIRDALACLDLDGPPSFYEHPMEERREHHLFLQRSISELLPPFKRQFCWLGYCGPWIEDLWNESRTLPFSRFGPFVPIFVPYVLLWISYRDDRRPYESTLSSIFSLFESKYLYVTVSHNDDGIDGRNNGIEIPKNLLILSQGGKGHIPLLLWLHPLNSSEYPIPTSYDYDIVFMGSRSTHWIRKPSLEMIRRYFGDRALIDFSLDWQKAYLRSKFILTPRGWGRNSYRLGEVLQMGMLPVYIYDDFVWLPYYNSINWSSIGFVLKLKEVGTALPKIQSITVDEARAMRLRVQSLYSTHFSPEAVMRQIFTFLEYGFLRSDLRCAKYSRKRSERV